MKKETVNTFEGGLNKDLNPIITPNNILTDNLNGTFITFNGDELSLQNDSGNTKIEEWIPTSEYDDLLPEDPNNPVEKKYVQLTPGFEPLGIKEYGGVLYIVSGRKATDELGRRSKADDEIEFGSYPSPKDNKQQTFYNSKTNWIDNEDKTTLYKSNLVHKEEFKAGRRIRFIEQSLNNLNLDYLWRPNNPNGFYVARLFLFLNSGSVELTNDIWLKYNYHVSTENPAGKHWLFDSSFYYHCPFNYKGLLMLRIEFQEPKFEVAEFYDIEDLNAGNFLFKIKLNEEDSNTLKISGKEIQIKTDSGYNRSYVNPNVVNGVIQINDIPKQHNNSNTSMIQYNIIPKLQYNGSNILWSEFPKEFQDKFVIARNIVINEELKDLTFRVSGGSCDNNHRLSDFIILINGNGEYVDTYNNPVIKPQAFFRQYIDENVYEEDYTYLGRFAINGEYAEIISFNDSEVSQDSKPFLSSKASMTKVIFEDITCRQSEVSFTLSHPVEMENGKVKDIELTMYGFDFDYLTDDGKTFIVLDASRDKSTISIQTKDFFTVSQARYDVNNKKHLNIPLKVNLTSLWNVRCNRQTPNRVIAYLPSFPKFYKPTLELIRDKFTNLPSKTFIESTTPNLAFSSLFAINETGDKVTPYFIIESENEIPIYLPISFVNLLEASSLEYDDAYFNLNNDSWVKLGSEFTGYILFSKDFTIKTDGNYVP